MQFQYVIVTTNTSPDHETFRFHLGWRDEESILLFPLKNGCDRVYHLEGVFAFERRIDDYSVYFLQKDSQEVTFLVKERDAHLRPNSPTPVFTFHLQNGLWVCEEEWPEPLKSSLHDVVPHGGRGFDRLATIVVSKLRMRTY